MISFWDPIHIVKSLSESKGLSKCDSTHIPNKISARQSVCLTLPDLDFNRGEMGHFAWNCLKPRENANIAQESEQNRNFGELMDFGDSSVCKECAMICTDVYSDEEYKNLIVYGNQGISTKTYDEETYGDLLITDSDEESIRKYNVAL